MSAPTFTGDRAAFAPEGFDVVLYHCDGRMTARSMGTTWEGKPGTGVEVDAVHYRCDLCGATADLIGRHPV